MLEVPSTDPQCDYLHEWGSSRNTLSIADVPASVLAGTVVYDDPALRLEPFIELHPLTPVAVSPLPPPQTPVPGFHPLSIADLLEPVVLEEMISQWIQANAGRGV